MGAYIGAVLPAFLLLMVDPWRALAFLVFLGILQQIEGNVIYPRVVGTSIGLPGIWVLAAVTVGGGLFGLLGVLLSVPVASVLYALLKQDVMRRLREKQPAEPETKKNNNKTARRSFLRRAVFLCCDQNRPVILPFSSTSIFSAREALGRPGMVPHRMCHSAGAPIFILGGSEFRLRQGRR